MSGLIPAKSKKKEFYIRRVKTEVADILTTIHDEIDYKTDYSVLKPLAKKMSQWLDISDFYKRYKVPFVRYLFDIEYDEWGAWTASSSVDVYQMPIDRDEKIALDAYNEAVGILKGAATESKKKTDIIQSLIVDFTDSSITVDEFVAKLERLPVGETVFKVKVSEKKSLKFYKNLEQGALLSLVSELDLKIIS